MGRVFKPSFLGVVLSVAYLCLGLIVSVLEFEGSWGGMVMFLFALPFFIVSFILSSKMNDGGFLFVFMNACWWYLLGNAVHILKSRRLHSFFYELEL